MWHIRRSLVWLVVSVVASGFFVLLASMRLDGPLFAIDIALGEFFYRLPHSALLIKSIKGVSLFGRELLLAIVALVSVGLAIYGRWWKSAVLIGTVLAAGMLNAWVRHKLEVVRPIVGHPNLLQESDGFPSGHTMMATVTYGLLLAFVLPSIRHSRLRISLTLGTIFLILVIGISRMYLGHHYLSDVIGGYVAGGAWLACCLACIQWLQKRRVFWDMSYSNRQDSWREPRP